MKMAKSVRSMSGHGATEEQLIAETKKWKQGTFAMIGLCFAVAGYNLLFYHHDHRGRDDLTYMNIRTKPFPWECSDCAYFDQKCWRKCRGKETEADKKETEEHEAHLRHIYGEDYVSYAAKEK